MKKLLITLIKIYKETISKIFSQMGFHCKYYPTCSEYTIQAIQKYGSIKGLYYGTKRIIRCNPFSKGGYDPLK